jgi:hypothetical protein
MSSRRAGSHRGESHGSVAGAASASEKFRVGPQRSASATVATRARATATRAARRERIGPVSVPPAQVSVDSPRASRPACRSLGPALSTRTPGLTGGADVPRDETRVPAGSGQGREKFQDDRGGHRGVRGGTQGVACWNLVQYLPDAQGAPIEAEPERVVPQVVTRERSISTSTVGNSSGRESTAKPRGPKIAGR